MRTFALILVGAGLLVELSGLIGGALGDVAPTAGHDHWARVMAWSLLLLFVLGRTRETKS